MRFTCLIQEQKRLLEENGNIQDKSNSSFQLTLEDLAQRVIKIVILFVELQFNFE